MADRNWPKMIASMKTHIVYNQVVDQLVEQTKMKALINYLKIHITSWRSKICIARDEKETYPSPNGCTSYDVAVNENLIESLMYLVLGIHSCDSYEFFLR